MGFAEIAQIIVEAYMKWQEMDSKKKFNDWQDEVSKKIQLILENTNEILRELRDFRIQIELNLDERFRTMYLGGLKASINGLLNIMAGIEPNSTLDEDLRERLTNQIDALRDVLYQSLTYGFATVPLALTGYTILRSAMSIAEIPEKEIKDTHERICQEVFLPALDITKVGSFAWTQDEMERSSTGLRQQVVNALRPVTIGKVGYPRSFWAISITFFGDPDNPESISNTNAVRSKKIYTKIEELPDPPLPYALPLVPSGDVNTRAVTLRKMFIEWANQSITNGKRSQQLANFNDALKQII